MVSPTADTVILDDDYDLKPSPRLGRFLPYGDNAWNSWPGNTAWERSLGRRHRRVLHGPLVQDDNPPNVLPGKLGHLRRLRQLDPADQAQARRQLDPRPGQPGRAADRRGGARSTSTPPRGSCSRNCRWSSNSRRLGRPRADDRRRQGALAASTDNGRWLQHRTRRSSSLGHIKQHPQGGVRGRPRRSARRHGAAVGRRPCG